MPIERARLGRTGIEVNRLGFGGIPIQSLAEEDAVSVVSYALDQGIDFINTGRGYTNSEERIGKALARARKKPVLSSKSMARTDEGIREQIKISLETLRVERLDLYFIPAVNSHEEYEIVMSPGGAYEGLQRARDEGLIGHTGVTSHNLPVLERAIEEGRFEAIMVAYSFLEPEAGEKVIPMAREKDVGVVVMKPFSGGVIESASLALKYVFSCPDLVAIPGIHTVKQAQENWRVFAGDWTYTLEELRKMEHLKMEFSDRFCRRCDHCQPCREGIPIWVVLGVKRILKNFGDMAFRPDWFINAIAAARNCSECGECEERCPYNLPIREMMKENLALFDARKRSSRQHDR